MIFEFVFVTHFFSVNYHTLNVNTAKTLLKWYLYIWMFYIHGGIVAHHWYHSLLDLKLLTCVQPLFITKMCGASFIQVLPSGPIYKRCKGICTPSYSSPIDIHIHSARCHYNFEKCCMVVTLFGRNCEDIWHPILYYQNMIFSKTTQPYK